MNLIYFILVFQKKKYYSHNNVSKFTRIQTLLSQQVFIIDPYSIEYRIEVEEERKGEEDRFNYNDCRKKKNRKELHT